MMCVWSTRAACFSYLPVAATNHGVRLQYMNNDGERTLRSYSRPVNLAAVFGPKWATTRGDAFHIAEFMVRTAISH